MSTIMNPARTPHRTLRDALAAAHRACDLPEPEQPTGDLADMIAKRPTGDAERAAIARESAHIVITDEWIEQAIDRLTRAAAADKLRALSADAAAARLVARMPAERAVSAAALAKPVAKAIKGLESAARRLHPADPLDDAAAVATGTGGELQGARDILQKLAAATEIWRPYTRFADHVSPDLRADPRWMLTALVSIPEVTVERRAVNVAGGKTLNPDETRTAVRRLIADAGKNLDRTILEVARGAYDGVTLSWASDRDTLTTRQELLERAEAIERVAVEAPLSPQAAVTKQWLSGMRRAKA